MTLNFSKIKGLIFDLDGTLADSMPLHFEAWHFAAQKYGIAFDEKKHDELAGIPTCKIIEIVSKEQGVEVGDYDVFNEQKEAYFLKHLDKVSVNKLVSEIIYQNHGKIPMSVGTGGSKYVAEKTIRFLKMNKYIPHLITSDDVKNFKPAPDTFLKCAELMNIPPQNCLVFEDAINGLQAAKNAGMQFVNVLDTIQLDTVVSYFCKKS